MTIFGKEVRGERWQIQPYTRWLRLVIPFRTEIFVVAVLFLGLSLGVHDSGTESPWTPWTGQGASVQLARSSPTPVAKFEKDTYSTTPLQTQELITEEFRYRMAEAGEVFLVWGLDGWTAVPDSLRPVGTMVEDGLMYTPMLHEDDTFVAKVQAPAGATIDYIFQITKTRNDTALEAWDNNDDQGYHTVAAQDGVIEVQTTLTLVEGQTPVSAPDVELLILIGLGIVFAIGTTLIIPRDATPVNFKTLFHRHQLVYLRDLLRELVVRDIRLRYKRSVLGVVWSLLNPLFQMLVFVFLSRRVLSLEIPNYPSFVFTGVLAWNWFQSTVVATTGAITGNREIIRRPGFPAAILPVVTVAANLIHFLLALPIPLLFLVFSGGRLTSTILALPPVIMLQFLLILSLGYLVSTVNVTFRDTQHILGVCFRLLFYLTPVFYDASSIPARYQVLYHLNPMFHLITAYRTILIQGDLPDLRALLALSVLTAGLLRLGHTVFQRASYRFVEEL
jgi:lipopolysaccharide transport system permease protein